MSGNIDPRLLIAPSLEMLFRDKTTGLPLVNGFVYFFKDTSRTTPKPVYTLTGTPGSYTYTALPNPIRLSAVGTFTDGAPGTNDIIPYYFPYDGTPTGQSNGNVELYYIVVTDQNGLQQFTRQAWPNFTSGSTILTNPENFVQNGQFRIHNNIPNSGLITSSSTNLAPNFYFERTVGSSAVDNVTFTRFTSYTSNPTTSPRYALNVVNSMVSATDNQKDFQIIWEDVNKFASQNLSNPQYYTFSFEAQTSGANIPVSVYLLKNYGSGGSTTTQELLQTFTVGPTYQIFSVQFFFGNNSLQTIGTGDDDYVCLLVRYPLDATFNVSATNFSLLFGSVTVNSFPIETDGEFKYQSIFGEGLPTPDYNGNSYNLPVIYTANGASFDTSVVGSIMTQISVNPDGSLYSPPGWYYCNGTKLITSNYSSDGVPNTRLFNRLFANIPALGVACPITGTGSDYLTACPVEVATRVRVDSNHFGAVTATADGTIATGFTFNIIASGSNTPYYVTGYSTTNSANAIFALEVNFVGAVDDPADFNTGFTFNIIRPTIGNATSTAVTFERAFISVPNTIPTPSQYWTFQSIDGAAATHNFYVWYTVNGVGSDPAPSGTGIKVGLLNTDAPFVVANKTAEALNGWQLTDITFTSGATVPAGSSFQMYGASNVPAPVGWYFWYTVDGVGTKPSGVGTGIKIAILSTDAANAVRNKTQIAINSYSYNVPDVRGYFLRAADGGSGNDPDRLTRVSTVPGINANMLGTYQFDEIYSHHHSPGGNKYVVQGTGLAIGAGTAYVATNDGPFFGGTESRPINYYVNYYIKY